MVKIFVGNCSEDSTSEDLRRCFSKFGTVVEADVLNGKGFGFVHMDTMKSAESAVSALDGSEFKGRKIRVELSSDRRSSRGGGPMRGGGGRGGGGGFRGSDRGGRGSFGGGGRGGDRGRGGSRGGGFGGRGGGDDRRFDRNGVGGGGYRNGGGRDDRYGGGGDRFGGGGDRFGGGGDRFGGGLGDRFGGGVRGYGRDNSRSPPPRAGRGDPYTRNRDLSPPMYRADPRRPRSPPPMDRSRNIYEQHAPPFDQPFRRDSPEYKRAAVNPYDPPGSMSIHVGGAPYYERRQPVPSYGQEVGIVGGGGPYALRSPPIPAGGAYYAMRGSSPPSQGYTGVMSAPGSRYPEAFDDRRMYSLDRRQSPPQARGPPMRSM